MATEERDAIGYATSFFNRYDRKCTTTACLPVHGDVLRVGLIEMSSEVFVRLT